MNKDMQMKHIVVALIATYEDLELHSLHIILDDGNYEDKDIIFCIDYCKKEEDYIGYEITKRLRDFTVEERKQIIERSWEIKNE